MNTIPELISAFGSQQTFGLICDPDSTRPKGLAADFTRRNAIPVAYWPNIIAKARAKGMSLDAAGMVALHTGQRPEEGRDPDFWGAWLGLGWIAGMLTVLGLYA